MLIHYDAMCREIALCDKLDEVADIHDKALAMQIYAKQAMNVEAERKATAIRLRAERKAGELMRGMQKTPAKDKAIKANATLGNNVPATVAGTSEYRSAIESAGIPERTAQRWQQLAKVPAEQFESALASAEAMPTTTGIVRAAVPEYPPAEVKQRMDTCSLWVWGRLRDFEREGYVWRDTPPVLEGMTETMRADVRRILPRFIEWAEQMIETEVT